MVHNDYLRPSGEENAAEAIARLLQDQGHEVLWFRAASSDINNTALAKAGAFFSGIHSRSSRQRMEETLDTHPIDLVHVQNLYPLLSPSVLKPIRERGIPIVMRCPNYRLFCPNGLHLSGGKVCERCLGGKEWWCVLKNCENSLPKSLGYAIRNSVARISRSIVDNVSVFIVLSEFQKKRFVAGGIPANRIAILPNTADGSCDLGKSEQGELITYIGRIAPEKGTDLFLDAAHRLPDYPFAVAGETSHLPELVKQAPSNVTFRGFLTDGPLDELYRKSRILVMPSRCFEGFPNVIAKAMMLSIPVVSANIGALPEIVLDRQTGLLHEPNSVTDLVEKIRRLYEDPSLCRDLGQRGKERAQQEYSPEAVSNRLAAIYDDVMTRFSRESLLGEGNPPQDKHCGTPSQS